MTVTLRQRDNGKKISLYLEYTQNRKRTYEYLNLYIIKPDENGKLTKQQKDENKRTLDLADNIRSKRKLEIQDGKYGFNNKAKLNGSFNEYLQILADKRRDSIGNYGNWDSALKHVRKFSKEEVLFSQIDKDWLERFKEYLLKTARSPSDKPLSSNTQCSYFNKIRAALKQALKDGIIQINPAIYTEGIQAEETERNFLTLQEVNNLVKVDCSIPILKTAFLFSVVTGLRWSDINKLMWSEVQHSSELGYYIRFRQKKTQAFETLPISEQAFQMLGERNSGEDRVFKSLKYSAGHNLKLQQWVHLAGIYKTVTFHCARHTYATLQLTLGTDIYTVSKLLGHKHIKTTQVYARVIDSRKTEAANKIIIEL
jgi:integrase